MSRRLLGFILLLASLGCASAPKFPLPYTKSMLSGEQKRPAAALIHYLKQPGADAAVCDTSASSPHVATVDKAMLKDLTAELMDGKVEPEIWKACVVRLFPNLNGDQTEMFVGRIAKLFLSEVEEIGDEPELAPRLAAIVGALSERPPADGADPVAEDLASYVKKARTLIAKGKLDPVGDGLARRFQSALELSLGEHEGQPVTPGRIDSTTHEPALLLMHARLPSAELRNLARARLVDLRVENSENSDVRIHAPEVKEAVLRAGRWALDLRAHPIVTTKYPPIAAFGQGILGRQDWSRGVVGFFSGEGLPSAVDLKGGLTFEVQGFAKPVSLCRDAKELSIEPCVPGEAVELSNPIVSLDEAGFLRYAESLGFKELLDTLSVAPKGGVLLRPAVGGVKLDEIELPLRMELPKDMLFVGEPWGMRGPDVEVTIRSFGERILVQAGDHAALLERDYAEEFTVASVGAKGEPGAPGVTGAPGLSGSPGIGAMCPGSPAGNGGSGGMGYNGGPGGPGGNGGDGGTVSVTVICDGRCPYLSNLATEIVRSLGGEAGTGGPGGAGGSGGAGGLGGMGTSCTTTTYLGGRSQTQYTTLPGGMAGSRGLDGARGVDGPPGLPGQPGRVVIIAR